MFFIFHIKHLFFALINDQIPVKTHNKHFIIDIFVILNVDKFY